MIGVCLVKKNLVRCFCYNFTVADQNLLFMFQFKSDGSFGEAKMMDNTNKYIEM